MAYTNCCACKNSYMDPDSEYLVCGLKENGLFGTYVKDINVPLDNCKGEKFEQHPLRNTNGSLKR
jgi:hypothetical protein